MINNASKCKYMYLLCFFLFLVNDYQPFHHNLQSPAIIVLNVEIFRLNLKNSLKTQNIFFQNKKVCQKMSEKCILYTFICFVWEIW